MSAVCHDAFVAACRARIAGLEPIVADGRVRALVGLVIEGEGVRARVGTVCRVEPDGGEPPFAAEVIGFREQRFLLMPLGEARGVGPGARVRVEPARTTVPAGRACLGRVLDGLGRPIDGGPPLDDAEAAPLHRRPEPTLARARIERPLEVGVKAIDAMLTPGRGGRLGIFAGSGVGKSTLLGQIARGTEADVNVIALVGERGREVREFLERDLGSALARSVVVVATSDEAPLLRARAALAATAIAEHFRDAGRHVLLLMDSLTRFCTALREIGLAAGEPPTTRGYTPSVWSALPRLLERAGTSAGAGSITGLYTVLVEGDDQNEPVADSVRAIVDGHVVLRRELAERGQYPPIDVLASVSRVMPDVVSPEHLATALRARGVLATFRNAEDLIAVGAYVAGSDRGIDEARTLEPQLRAFLRQGPKERSTLAESVAALGAALRPPAAAGARP
jgi:flagellum-specific ATP synthase